MAVRRTEAENQHTSPVSWLKMGTSLLHVLRNNPKALKFAAVPAGTLVFLFLLNLFFGGRVPPNVFVLDTALGGLSHDDAVQKLESWWQQGALIRFSDGSHEWTATPTQLGMHLDAEMTVKKTDSVGVAGIPFGYSIDPLVSVDEAKVHQFLEELAHEFYIAPVNARYEWRSDTLVGIPGREGIQLDVDAVLRTILHSPLEVLKDDVILTTVPLPPIASSPDIFLDAAQQFVTAPFQLTAYDPFEDRYINLAASPEVLSTWIEAGENGLNARSSSVTDTVEMLNGSAPTFDLPAGSYLNREDVITAINQSLATGSTSAQVTLKFYPTTYEVVLGDTGYRIARKTGIPFFLVEAANPERDLSVLSPGDVINLPSRDVTLPLPVVANKRIVVDLETQSLVAFQDSQIVFSWQISSGIAEAPTSPGVYQIISHEPVAYGSSYALCGDAGCGQWEMNWFMGIYEAVPGLVNGFHGAVLLPNGTYLGGNNVGAPYTLGCVMSRDDEARQLYEWADHGTIVEIISSEFLPRSDLARRVLNSSDF